MVLVLYPATTTYLVLCALFRPWLKMLCQSDIAVPCIALRCSLGRRLHGIYEFQSIDMMFNLFYLLHTLKILCI